MAGKRYITIRSPYDEDEAGRTRNSSSREVRDSLKECSRNRKKLTKQERIESLKGLLRKIKRDKKRISEMISKESGLCLKDTQHEVDRTTDLISCAERHLIDYDTDITKSFSNNKKRPYLSVRKHPMRMVCAITPFNHPLNQVAHKVIPNVLADSNIILKPSEKTPLTAVYFFNALHESGFPVSQYRIIVSDDPISTVREMIHSEGIEAMTFTGGIKAGLSIARKIANSPNPFIRQIYELGGNSAAYISENADIRKAARICLGAFSNSGQRCTSIKRVLLSEEIASEFIEEFLGLAGKLRYGDPMNHSTDVGCMITEEAAAEVQSRVHSAMKEGAKLLLGNEREGALLSPTVLDNVNTRSKLVVEETFGPVAPITRVKDARDAAVIVNSSRYALAGSIVTENRKEALEYYSSIETGQFNWNDAPGFRFESAPFGGFGFSGNYQKEGLIMAADQYQKIRTFYEH